MSTKETVIFSGAIVSNDQRVECRVRAIKTTLDPTIPPAFSEYTVMNSDVTDRLPDGDNYEIHLSDGERIPVRRQHGHFLARS
jgi:hypothetical protein